MVFCKKFLIKYGSKHLSVLLIKDNVTSKINLSSFSSKRGSPYKSTSFLALSDNELKISRNGFYTIHKNNMILGEIMEMQKVM